MPYSETQEVPLFSQSPVVSRMDSVLDNAHCLYGKYIDLGYLSDFVLIAAYNGYDVIDVMLQWCHGK